MIINIDFNNNEVTIDDSIYNIDLTGKEDIILKDLGLEKISMEEVRKDINDLFSQLDFNNVKCDE